MNWKLIGSAVNVFDLIKMLETRWHWSSVGVNEDGTVYTAKGIVDGMRVVKRRDRFRLEMRQS